MIKSLKNIVFVLSICLFNLAIAAQEDYGEQILTQPVQGTSHLFGESVSIDGNYAVIGAPNENDATGAANIFKKDVNGNWNHIQKITAFVGQSIDEYFGSAVHIQGDFIFIGAPTDRLNEERFESPAGSVMIYKNNGADNFIGIQRIRSSDIEFGDYFGEVIDAYGDYLLVGAPFEDEDAVGANRLGAAGSAYIFKKDNNDVWSQVQKIVPSHRKQLDYAGYNLAISENHIILGSKNDTDVADLNPLSGNGSVFVFEKGVGDNWTEMQKLKASDGLQISHFGWNGLDVSEGYIAVSSIGPTNNESIYMFEINGARDSWTEIQKVATTPVSGDISFGKNLALTNDYLIASAPGDYITKNGQNISSTGTAYIFKNNNSNWSQLLRVEASDAALNDAFGGGFDVRSAVSFDGTSFIIGAPYKDGEFGGNTFINSGKAYISGDVTTFSGQNITWTGAISTDWNTAGNWDNNNVPNANDDVILADVANSPKINFNQSYTVNNLTINENLTIKNNASLTVNGNLNQGANIQVESFVNGSGSFILRGNQTNVNPADLIYLRYVSGNNWHLFSSPATHVDIDVLAAATQLAEGQNNNRGIGFYNNNANPSWSYYQNGAVNSGDFIDGKGYSIRTSANAFLNFTGKLKANNLTNYPITENLNGWNLVGNPYPANINANVNAGANENFLTENAAQLDPAFANIYIWNPNTNSYDPVGNGLGARHIAPGQAFFVKSKNGGGTIDINKSMLTHQIGNLFLKNNKPEKIVLQIDDKTNISETTIAFKKGMTKGLDITYDAAVFSGESINLSLYSNLLENGKNTPFAIQFLPELDNNNFIVPLGITQNKASEITLSLKENTIQSNVKIYLEDKIENAFTEISNNINYKFYNEKEASETDRFFLHFQQKSLNINTVDAPTIDIHKDKNNAINIKGISNGMLNIFSITGQNIIENYKLKNESEKIILPKLSKGVYFINVKNNEKKFTKKILF